MAQEDYPVIPNIEIPARIYPRRSKWTKMVSQLEVGSGVIMPRAKALAFKEHIRIRYPEYVIKSLKKNSDDPDCNLYILWRDR